MTLREKFAEFTKQESWEKENYNAKECEQIADDYAIDFLNWYISISSIMDKKYIGKTSKEILEIFKIEKGL